MEYCTMCNTLTETRYIDLYVVGSEGTRLCHECEMKVVEYIRDMARAYAIKARDRHLKRRTGA